MFTSGFGTLLMQCGHVEKNECCFPFETLSLTVSYFTEENGWLGRDFCRMKQLSDV